MNLFSDQSSADVAREAEAERAGLVNTLGQIRENLRPENMVDEVFSQAQSEGSDLMDKIWGLARANPIPAALIGIGAAMLVSAGQRFKAQKSGAAERWPVYDAGTSPRRHDDVVTPAALEDTWPPMSLEVSDAAKQASRPPLNGLTRLFDEQPLVLAAIGIAVGTAVGSAIPSTSVESQIMGDASESVRRNASAMARDQVSQFRSTAYQTLDQMKATAAEHGLSAENVSGLVHDLGEDVKAAGRTATSPSGTAS